MKQEPALQGAGIPALRGWEEANPFARARRRRPLPATDDPERLAAALLADMRPPRIVLRELGTVQLRAHNPRYGRPEDDRLGANRWPTPGAAWPCVKTAPGRWVDVGTWRALGDDEVAGYLEGRWAGR